MTSERIIFWAHAIQRMFERRISADDVRQVLATGRTIEDYPNDTQYPSKLRLGWRADRPLHVVAAHNTADDETIVITVYEPDPDQWAEGFKRRQP